MPSRSETGPSIASISHRLTARSANNVYAASPWCHRTTRGTLVPEVDKFEKNKLARQDRKQNWKYQRAALTPHPEGQSIHRIERREYRTNARGVRDEERVFVRPEMGGSRTTGFYYSIERCARIVEQYGIDGILVMSIQYSIDGYSYSGSNGVAGIDPHRDPRPR